MYTVGKLRIALFIGLVLAASCSPQAAPVATTQPADASASLRIAFLSDREGDVQLYTIAVDGSGLTKLTDLPGQKGPFAFSPDGRRLVFRMALEPEEYRDTYLMDVEDLSTADLARNPPLGGDFASWAPDGQSLAIVSTKGLVDTIRILSLDGTEITSVTFPALLLWPSSFPPLLAWSLDSSRIAFAAHRGDKVGGEPNTDVYVVNRDGSGLKRLTDAPRTDDMPVWAPDDRIYFRSSRDGNLEIYVMNSDGAGQVNLTNQPSNEGGAIPSPDGRQIAFFSDRDGNQDLFVMNSDGTDQVNVSRSPGIEVEVSWSPDGKWLAFTTVDQDGNGIVCVVDSKGEHLVPLTHPPTRAGFPAWVPPARP